MASGKKKESAFFKVFFKSGTNTKPLIGVAISGSLYKKAHERNQARRAAYQAILSIYPSLPKNLNLVIMPKAGILDKTTDLLAQDLKNVQTGFTNN